MVPSTPPSKGAAPEPIPTKPIACRGRACTRTYVRTVWQQDVPPLVKLTMGKAAAQPWARHWRRLAISPAWWASTSTQFRTVLHGRGQHTSHRRLPRLPASTRRGCTKKTQSRPIAPSGACRYLLPLEDGVPRRDPAQPHAENNHIHQSPQAPKRGGAHQQAKQPRQEAPTRTKVETMDYRAGSPSVGQSVFVWSLWAVQQGAEAQEGGGGRRLRKRQNKPKLPPAWTMPVPLSSPSTWRAGGWMGRHRRWHLRDRLRGGDHRARGEAGQRASSDRRAKQWTDIPRGKPPGKGDTIGGAVPSPGLLSSLRAIGGSRPAGRSSSTSRQ